MAKKLTPLTEIHRQQLESEAPFIWLYEIEVPGDPVSRYRLTNFTEDVFFKRSSSGARLKFSAAPIVHGDIIETSDGSLPKFSVTIGNTGAIMARTVDAADGFVDQPVTVSLVSIHELDNPSAALTETGEVESATITREGLAFNISPFNLYALQFPPFIYVRRRCRYAEFGGSRCGYLVNAPGAAFSECGFTYEDCGKRGDDEVARGLPRLHPRRFGGFPGIPRAGG